MPNVEKFEVCLHPRFHRVPTLQEWRHSIHTVWLGQSMAGKCVLLTVGAVLIPIIVCCCTVIDYLALWLQKDPAIYASEQASRYFHGD